MSSVLLSPLVPFLHKSVKESEIFLLVDLVEFMDEDWFHNPVIEPFPVEFTSSLFLLHWDLRIVPNFSIIYLCIFGWRNG